jgi:pyridinium-3,5-bisthiocarboxylic acid mononucleotide nickel chelatase
MKHLYMDMPSGISGDMTLAAFLDVGVPEQALRDGLERFGLGGYELVVSAGEKGGITGTHVEVRLAGKPHEPESCHPHYPNRNHEHSHDHDHAHDDNPQHSHDHEHGHDHGHDHGHAHSHEHDHDHEHAHNSWSEIRGMIQRSHLHEEEKALAVRIFQRVADAEGKIHGKPADDVGFHEVGAVDSIVDIVGAAICMCWLKPDHVTASPANTGSGFVKCQHGVLPVPAPATAEILSQGKVPAYAKGSPGERTTPTGAAIVAEFAHSFGVLPPMVIGKIGYGVGTKDFDSPNVLRMFLGEDATSAEDEVTVLEANMDDMTGEAAGYLLGKLFDAGARDAFYVPVQMKKNRPGLLLTVIASTHRVQSLEALMFRESSTIGIRRSVMKRSVMDRSQQTVLVAGQEVSVKVSTWQDIRKAAPEYEDVRQVAERTGLSFRTVYQMAEAAFASIGSSVV